MAVLKETTIHRYVGLAADTRPTGVPVGSTYLAYNTDALEITYDGTNWVQIDRLVKLVANSGVDVGDVDVLSIAAGDNNIGNVDVVTLPAANLGQRAMAASLSVVPASDIADATYLGDIKFGEALPAGTASLGGVKDDGPQVAGTATYTSSADMSTAADIGPAPTAGQKSVLRQAVMSAAVALEFTLQMETTPGAERISVFLPANGTVIFIPRYPLKLGTADKKWQGKASVAGNVRVHTTTTSEV